MPPRGLSPLTEGSKRMWSVPGPPCFEFLRVAGAGSSTAWVLAELGVVPAVWYVWTARSRRACRVVRAAFGSGYLHLLAPLPGDDYWHGYGFPCTRISIQEARSSSRVSRIFHGWHIGFNPGVPAWRGGCRYTELGQDGATALVEGLRWTPGLKRLILRCCPRPWPRRRTRTAFSRKTLSPPGPVQPKDGCRCTAEGRRGLLSNSPTPQADFPLPDS